MKHIEYQREVNKMYDVKLLNQNLEEFKRITEKLIYKLDKDEIENIDMLIEQREKIIDEIGKLNYEKEEFVSCGKALGLNALEKKLNNIYVSKKNDLYHEMQYNKEKIIANKNYVNNSQRRINFIDEKI
ncbi:hypothetical protein [Clostridium polynesiense]|uniref:hypothetical protein n=1 Tax=Clostridium polynesiense TaxID=1325933 RepID=UPI00069349B4|nr:hypothetical protein [Clostridium polynesiense]